MKVAEVKDIQKYSKDVDSYIAIAHTQLDLLSGTISAKTFGHDD